MEENWVFISGSNELYMISNTGLVKSLSRTIFISTKNGVERCANIKEKILKSTNSNGWYQTVVLYIGNNHKTVKIHRLVAEHFIDNPNSYKCVNHKDGNKQNNNVGNLEWCSYSENSKHAFREKLREPVCCENHRSAKIKNSDVLEIRRLYSSGCSQSEILKLYPLGYGIIGNIVRNTTWRNLL